MKDPSPSKSPINLVNIAVYIAVMVILIFVINRNAITNQFILELYKGLSWQVIVALAIFIYRKPLGLFIQNIKLISYKDGQLIVELEDEIDQLSNNLQASKNSAHPEGNAILAINSTTRKAMPDIIAPIISMTDVNLMIGQLNTIIDSLYNKSIENSTDDRIILDTKNKLVYFLQKNIIDYALFQTINGIYELVGNPLFQPNINDYRNKIHSLISETATVLTNKVKDYLAKCNA